MKVFWPKLVLFPTRPVSVAVIIHVITIVIVNDIVVSTDAIIVAIIIS